MDATLRAVRAGLRRVPAPSLTVETGAGAVPAPTPALDLAADAWRNLLPGRHLFGVLLLVVAIGWRFAPSLLNPGPYGDELPHASAIRLAAEGRSPYVGHIFVYPPSTLRIGAALQRLSPGLPFLPMRCLIVCGLVALVWSSAAWLPGSYGRRLGLALLFVLLAPGVRQGIEFGNITFAAGGLLVAALLAWPRAPVLSGLALGASLLLKPLAPAGFMALAAYRGPTEKSPTHRLRRNWVAAGVAAVVAAAALLPDPQLAAFLRQGPAVWSIDRTVSLFRLLHLAQAERFAPLALVALLALVAVVVRRFVHDRLALLAVSVAACVVSTPVVWNHTLVLTLPLQSMALTVAWARYRAAGRGVRTEEPTIRPLWELVAVALALAALTFGEGATAIDDQAVGLQVLGTLPQALAPILLTIYVLHFRNTPQPLRDSSQRADRR
ncbi:MAG: glycosyltransferase 87 family protein [Thermoanaerobaculia bacterium]